MEKRSLALTSQQEVFIVMKNRIVEGERGIEHR
jgi:hypothetical protein